MILDHPLISARYFFPRLDPPPSKTLVEAAVGPLHCMSVVLDASWPTLVHFHGNGEVCADYADWRGLLARWKLNGFFAEYRGYGGSAGVPQLVSMLADVVAVRQHLKEIDASQLLVFGRSVGSIYAIEFARRYPDIAGLVLESGIADPLQRVLLRVRPEEVGASLHAMQEEATAYLDHEAKLKAYSQPLLVLHATHDSLVRVRHGEDNHRWAGSEQKRLVTFPEGDHNTIFGYNQQAYVDEVSAFRALALGS